MRAKSGWNNSLRIFLEILIIYVIILKKDSSDQSKYAGCNYLVWLDCRALHMDNEELKDFMIHKAGLGLNDGSSFTRTMNGFMRLNAACPRSVLEKALKQLEDAVNSLNN